MLRHMLRVYVYAWLRMRVSRLAVPILVLAALLFPGPGAARTGADVYPLFYVGGDGHDLGQRNGLYFDLLELSSAGKAARIAITTPGGYRLTPSHPPGFYLGEADVYTSKGTYSGEIGVVSRAVFAGDPSVPGCAAGPHAAVWMMLLKGAKGRLTVPVAVDRSGSGLKLTVCLGAFDTPGVKIDEVYLVTRSVFRNPVRNGVYRFTARVVPLGADGSPAPEIQYEVRADEPLPQDVTVTSAVYDRTTHLLTVGGAVHANDKPRDGINVHMFAGQSSDVDRMNEVGLAVTGRGGTYTYTKRILIPPAYVVAYVRHYDYDKCQSRSSAPGGCASESIDGGPSQSVKVTTHTTVP
jgi:hypothetical protein